MQIHEDPSRGDAAPVTPNPDQPLSVQANRLRSADPSNRPELASGLGALTTGLSFSKVVMVTNRQLYEPSPDGSYTRTPGGLATAVHQVLASTPGSAAISWDVPSSGKLSLAEFNERIAKSEFQDRPYDAKGVPLSKEEVKAYYEGYANGVLWPVMHSLLDRLGEVRASDWAHYGAVNRRFAEEVAKNDSAGGLIWIHDYHLMLAGGMIRDLQPQAHLGYFHHIPFPEPQVFEQAIGAEHRAAILRGLLGNDLVGFHTAGYAQRFLENVEHAGIADHVDFDRRLVCYQGRNVAVGVFPISIDVGSVEALSRSANAQSAYEDLMKRFGDKAILFGVDRLDYTKGIEERLSAVGVLLEQNPELKEKFRMVQYVAPSRTGVPEYQELRNRVLAEVQRVNDAHGSADWKPIEYVEQNLPFEAVLGFSRAADVVVVTPLIDGMNLVIKEAIVASEGRSAFILGKGAGAAEELKEALIVDGRSPASVADAMREALRMHAGEPERIRSDWEKLKARIDAYPIEMWRMDFMTAARDAANKRTEDLVQ